MSTEPITSISPEVFAKINHELLYQDRMLRDIDRSNSDGLGNEVAGQLVTLSTYTQKAIDAWTLNSGQQEALDVLRKVAAIAIRALEQHGCPSRIMPPGYTEE